MIIFLLASFFGCIAPQKMVKIPRYENMWQIQTGDFPKPEDVSEVMTIFYRYWYLYFGTIPLCMDSVMIEWRDNTREGRGYSITGNKVAGRIKGVALSPGYIWVWKGTENKISSTALVHELIHCALWCSTSHGDPDHEGGKYEGWTPRHSEFLHKINYLLQSKGM